MPWLAVRVTGSVCEKIAQNVVHPIFVKINRQLLAMKKVDQKLRLLLYFGKNCPK
jgi:hypothetical protein